ncbi:glycosyltransferase family 2 protein [Butyrivibrio sp. WCD2001]|uniref:glycosyltransferase family 2 protein n=1 Tax=Butyrivibrio sp. WCD2001 TaxID=1280681 RepID=UPI0004251DE3|nr:glycosyltransferase family 2 protein [Butyrivibrio sp. WCD2001]
MIKVSVIIPVYNMEKYIEECLDSIEKQTLFELEILCIDDGSTDNSCYILEQYSKRFHNIRVLRQERKGPGAARNLGLEVAKGEFVAFMDADDFYASEDVLQNLYDGAKENGVKAAAGGLVRLIEGKINDYSRDPFYNKINFQEEKVINFSEYQYPFYYTRFIFLRSDLIKGHISFPAYTRFEDPVFLVKALDYLGSFLVIPEYVYVARTVNKRLNFYSKNVINDIARGILDIISIASKRNYYDLMKLMLDHLKTWKKPFLIQKYKGNTDIISILCDIDKLVDMSLKDDGYYLRMTKSEMTYYIESYKAKVNSIIQQMETANEVVIYGAGKYGTSVYDVISENKKIRFIGFAVTNIDPENQYLCDHKIKRINEYNKDVLVVIAAHVRHQEAMIKNAKSLGFHNVVSFDDEMIDVDAYEINNESFAI